MRIHCLGAGAIGSLVCHHLKLYTPHSIRLHLRKKQPQHRASFRPVPGSLPPPLTIQLRRPRDFNDPSQRELITETSGPYDVEFATRPKQDGIQTLLVTLKAQNVVAGITPLLPRLSAQSTVILLHNGLGVLEDLMATCFPSPATRPSFILANTTHGVHGLDSGDGSPGAEACHGRFHHAGKGALPFAVLPSVDVVGALKALGERKWYWPEREQKVDSALVEEVAAGLDLDSEMNPLLNVSSEVTPSLDRHLPYLPPETTSLHTTISMLLSPPIQDRLGTTWLPLPRYQEVSLAKLAVNCVVNPLTALADVRNGALLGSTAAANVGRSACAEASKVFAKLLEEQRDSRLTDADKAIRRGTLQLEKSHPLHPYSLERTVSAVLQTTAGNISSTLSDVRKAREDKVRRSRIELMDRAMRVEQGISRDALLGREGGGLGVQSVPGDPLRLEAKPWRIAEDDTPDSPTPSASSSTPSSTSSTTLSPNRYTQSARPANMDLPASHELTEINHLNGYVSRLGVRFGVPTPVNDTLRDLVRFKAQMVGAGLSGEGRSYGKGRLQ